MLLQIFKTQIEMQRIMMRLPAFYLHSSIFLKFILRLF